MFSKGPLPPRNLIVVIAAITVIPLFILLWLGWRLLDQDRILERQQAQERLERAADLVVGAVQRSLASSEHRLGSGAREWPDGAVAVAFGDTAEAYPPHRVAYLPVIPKLPEASASTFENGEALEFQKRDYAGAIAAFGKLAQSPDPAIRAGGLVRLGRNLANAGRTAEALAAFDQLGSFDYVAVTNTPASLIGRYARCELLLRTRQTGKFETELNRFSDELNSGRWRLTPALHALYAGDVGKWTGKQSHPKHRSEVLAEAAVSLWERRRSLPMSGRESMDIGDQKVTVIWQRSGETLRALIALPEFAESQWLSSASTVAAEQRVSLRIDERNAIETAVVKRPARETELPWTLTVTSTADRPADFLLRRRLLISVFVLLAGMSIGASYFIVRSVSRELAVARLQSDFVAAVSHEFRTPLTALRQFTDMLRDNERHPSDRGKERRLLCYDAQSRATERLTKLVESLLDFGRMEAGARRYKFEQRDSAELVRSVVEDFRKDAAADGYQINFSGNGSAPIEADDEALARALWNLLDNAVKYSPENRLIEVELHRNGERVHIDIRDHGLGIPEHERAAIFSKFQRGAQARSRGIQGTGIGLAIVQEIVQAHRGQVEVTSEPGKGSTFSIVLPAAKG